MERTQEFQRENIAAKKKWKEENLTGEELQTRIAIHKAPKLVNIAPANSHTAPTSAHKSLSPSLDDELLNRVERLNEELLSIKAQLIVSRALKEADTPEQPKIVGDAVLGNVLPSEGQNSEEIRKCTTMQTLYLYSVKLQSLTLSDVYRFLVDGFVSLSHMSTSEAIEYLKAQLLATSNTLGITSDTQDPSRELLKSADTVISTSDVSKITPDNSVIGMNEDSAAYSKLPINDSVNRVNKASVILSPLITPPSISPTLESEVQDLSKEIEVTLSATETKDEVEKNEEIVQNIEKRS